MYISKNLNYTILQKTSNEFFQSLWIEINFINKRNSICGIIYRQHNRPNEFLTYFENILEKYSSTQKNIYIIGDFNIVLLKCEFCTYSETFLLSLQSWYLFPTIDKPTRVYNSSATLIDNILMNNPTKGVCSGNIITYISDHFSQFCIVPAGKEIFKLNSKKIRHFSRCFEYQFCKQISTIDLGACFVVSNDVEMIFSSLYRKINSIINEIAPLERINNRTAKQLSKPWITHGIRESIKTKNRLFASGNRERYIYYRNKIVHLVRISKKSYYESLFESNQKNSKKHGRPLIHCYIIKTKNTNRFHH